MDRAGSLPLRSWKPRGRSQKVKADGFLRDKQSTMETGEGLGVTMD